MLGIIDCVNLDEGELYEDGFEPCGTFRAACRLEVYGAGIVWAVETEEAPRCSVEVYTTTGDTMGQGYGETFADAWEEAKTEAVRTFAAMLDEARASMVRPPL